MFHLVLFAMFSASNPNPSSVDIAYQVSACAQDAVKKGIVPEGAMYFCSCVYDATRANITDVNTIATECSKIVLKEMSKKTPFGAQPRANYFNKNKLGSAFISRGMLECKKSGGNDSVCDCSMNYFRTIFSNKGQKWVLGHITEMNKERLSQCTNEIKL